MECTDKNEDSKFDEIMEKVGYMGKFQKRFNIIFNVLMVCTACMPLLNMILALSVPEHWCHVPGREHTNYTLDQWKNLMLPKETDTRGRESVSKCKMYNASYENVLSKYVEQDFQNMSCQHGWEYDDTWYIATAPSQEDWVCDNELKVSNALAFGRIGDVVGTFIFGLLGDTIGRRPVWFITFIALICGRLLSAFTAHNYFLFVFSILLGNLTAVGVFQSPMCIAMEISNERGRAHIAMIQCVSFNVGMCLLPLIYWACGHWVQYMLATTLPCVLFFILGPMFMIESPRWLASRGKTARAVRVLERVAKINGTKVPDDAMITLRQKNIEPEKVYGALSLFSSWRLAKNTLLLLICCVKDHLTIYVIMLNVNMLGGNPFMNYFWQALAELPSYFFGRWTSDRFGRRWTQVIPTIIAGLACIPLGLLITDPSMELYTGFLAAFVKFCATYSFYAQYLQQLEIYPTCLRQSGLSLGHIFGSALGILGPYIVYLGTTYDARYPYLILTLLCLLGGISASFLPETLNQKLPETLADAHVFGADQKYWSLPKRKLSNNEFSSCKQEET